MDGSTLTTIRLLLPRVPLIVKTAIWNLLSLSATSSKQGTVTEVAVAVIRSLMRAKATIGELQHISRKDPGISGSMWVSQVAIDPAPEVDQLHNIVCDLIKELGSGNFAVPTKSEIRGEWIGYRNVAGRNAPRPTISEKEHYKSLMEEVSSPLTVLYFHGGAYFLMSTASHRKPTSHLGKLTGGRCFLVDYRLAPQHAFPSQLMDALLSYLYLLSPPEEAYHESVPASNIVFAGDSAGGHLSLSLLQLLLALQHSGQKTLPFHGKDVPIQLPAGVALSSPWCDVSRCMPSVIENAQFDYLDPPGPSGAPVAEIIADDIWPAKPPRSEIFCSGTILANPLVSPFCASAEQWKGMPPVLMILGNEGLQDECEVVAHRMNESGGNVHFVGYEGMPHCFGMIFPTSVAGRDYYRRFSEFCVQAIEGTVEKLDRGKWMKAFSNPLQYDEIPLSAITKYTEEEIEARLNEAKHKSVRRETEALEKWMEESQSRARL